MHSTLIIFCMNDSNSSLETEMFFLNIFNIDFSPIQENHLLLFSLQLLLIYMYLYDQKYYNGILGERSKIQCLTKPNFFIKAQYCEC